MISRGLGIFALASIGSITLGGLAIYSVLSEKSAFSVVNSNDFSYTLTVTASDIDRGYAETTSGNRIDFESSKVSNVDGKLSFEKDGYFRLLTKINGTTSFSINPSGSWGSKKITLSSGYGVGSYGASEYLDSSNTSTNTYFRTYFELSSESSTLALESFAIEYTCKAHYNFFPVLRSITSDVDYNELATYDGLDYLPLTPTPNPSEVDIVMENDTIQVDSEGDPIYTLHPVARFYDKGGCLIKEATGLWVVHVNPIIRFFISKTESIDFTLHVGDAFDTSKLDSGVLSSFDWTEHTKTGGALDGEIERSLDLYPKITMNISPGANAANPAVTSQTFTPDPSQPNYNFPTIPAPETQDGYTFSNWYEDDHVYDPAAAEDFHDYDLYGVYTSEFDLRLKFRNRGFETPYFEVGIPNGDSYSLSDATGKFFDQAITGLEFAESKGYIIYEEGKRYEAVPYESDDTFVNDGKGTDINRKVYIAEPYTYIDKSNSTYGFSDKKTHNDVDGYGVESYSEYGYGSRSYFKTAALPDFVKDDGKLKGSCFTTGNYFTANHEEHDPTKAKGINNTKELEVICGNDAFYEIGQSGFAHNPNLKEIEHFPNLDNIHDYAFYQCPNLTPFSDWTDVGNIHRIGTHAFDSCYRASVYNEEGQRIRRTITIPSTVNYIGGCAFSGASQTDFHFYPSGDYSTDSLWRRPFGQYHPDGEGRYDVHSPEFAEVKRQYDAAEGDAKTALIPLLRLYANRVIFHGTRSQWETLYNQGGYSYDDAKMLETLLSDEYYVVFTDEA